MLDGEAITKTTPLLAELPAPGSSISTLLLSTN
jgi:hypothetical protein